MLPAVDEKRKEKLKPSCYIVYNFALFTSIMIVAYIVDFDYYMYIHVWCVLVSRPG